MNVDRAFFARVFLNAPVAGALYLGLLYAAFVTEPLVPPNQVLLGRDAKDIADYVAIRFASEIESIGLTLAGVALGLGALLGVIALLLLALRARVQGAPRRLTGWRAALAGLAVVVALHAGALLVSMSRWPQLYAEQFWGRGGVLAGLQVLASDRLGARGVLALLGAGLVLFVLGAPWRWPAHARRLLAGARRLRGSPRPLLTALALAMVVGLAVAVAVGPRSTPSMTKSASAAATPGSPSRPPRRRSVLVIASDGLRPDRLTPEIAPHMTALAARGTRFEHAYVGLPRTMSSWVSILTGQHAHTHRVRSGFPRWEDVDRPLDTVPARLRAAGYKTVAVSDYAGDVFNRADFGFGTVDAPPITFPAFLREQAIERSVPLLPFLQSRAGRAAFPELARWSGAADPRFVASSAVDALRRVGDDPFFMVVFFSTTHFPYAAPAPYHTRFTRADYTGPFRYEKRVSAGVPVMPNAADVEQIRGLYDGAVAAVDDAMGTVLDAAARTGAGDDLLIVLTSDHGELLFEHDRWHGHGDHLFGDQATHVPLLVVDPRAAPRTEPALVASVDIAPTLYELLGVPPGPHLDGRSLAPAVRGEALSPKPVFAETELLLGDNPGLAPSLHFPAPSLGKLLEIDTDHGNQIVLRKAMVGPTLLARQRMVRDDRWKLVYIPTPRGVVYRLFDTVNDPDELTDVAAKEPSEAARLRSLLWEWMLTDPLMTRDGDYLVPKGTRAPAAGTTN